jgi:hypothetical protein
METRPKLVVHEGLTQLQEMRLEMLRNVIWRVIVLPLAWLSIAIFLLAGVGWFVMAFLAPLLQALSHR